MECSGVEKSHDRRDKQQKHQDCLGGGFNCFLFSPRFVGRWSNLTCAYFSVGWFNHQLVFFVDAGAIKEASNNCRVRIIFSAGSALIWKKNVKEVGECPLKSSLESWMGFQTSWCYTKFWIQTKKSKPVFRKKNNLYSFEPALPLLFFWNSFRLSQIARPTFEN